MKKTLVVIFALFMCLGIHAQMETLTNQSILDMKGLGFSEDIIIAKIQNSNNAFDTSIEALKDLKEKGISDNILMVILNNSNTNSKDDNSNSVESSKRLGIFISEDQELIRVLPSIFSGTKTNTLGSSLSYGLASSSIKTILNNPVSANIVQNVQPEFVFFFANQNDQSYINNGNNWWFFAATSPNEFVLVELDKKRKTRELITGSVNIYAGTSIGVDENSTIPFDIIPINDYTFKVIPTNPLEPGEYCFLYQGTIPHGGYNNLSAFDFSIPGEASRKSKIEKSKLRNYGDDTYF